MEAEVKTIKEFFFFFEEIKMGNKIKFIINKNKNNDMVVNVAQQKCNNNKCYTSTYIYIYIYRFHYYHFVCFWWSVEQTAPNFTIINLLEVSFFWVRNLQQKSYCFTWNDFWYLYN